MSFLRVAALALCSLFLAGEAAAFGYAELIERARTLAAQPYSPPPQIPRFLRELSYDDYQGIRFQPSRSLWRENRSRHQVMFFPAGLFFTHPVRINVLEAQGVSEVPFRKGDFEFSDPDLERRVPADLGYAGFRLSYPLENAGEHNQFLVFAGASYFRGVARGNAWGISGRGIAVDTGRMSGEEFPSFIEFWLERPAPDAQAMRFYGLLDGKSLSGAYRFVAHPGNPTRLEVDAELFPRADVELLGLAPLTSMFFYGENTGRPSGEWRPEVHDSDGLLIQDAASGEWLWSPLLNPVHLQTDFFHTGELGGFGLLQRDGAFANYQDLGARYERRPSAWIAPRAAASGEGVWKDGRVVLVQLPTNTETNDNIVAFWNPREAVEAGRPIRLSYTVSFGDADLMRPPMARSVQTFVGDGSVVGGGDVKGAVRFLVDFAGGALERKKPRTPVLAEVTATEGGEVLEHFVEYNEALGTWRLSILARPAPNATLALRAYLREGEATLTETWTYRLPPNNDILVTRR